MILVIGQIFGLLNGLFAIISVNAKNKINMLYWSFFANLFAGINMYVLRQMSFVYIIIITLVQIIINIIHCKRNNSAGYFERTVFFILFVSAGALGYKSIKDILPIAAVISSMFAIFQKDEQRSRLWYLLNGGINLFYAYLAGSSMVISHLINIASILAGLYRFRNKERSPE